MRSVRDEYDYLIHLIRCQIQSFTPSEIPDGVIFDSVYKCGVSHDVANIAYSSVEKLSVKPDAELFSKWRARRDAAIVRDVNQSFAASEIREGFRKAGIRNIEYQGTKLKDLYPCREYRTMSDIDFIVDPARLNDAKVVLEELGFECKYNRGVEVDGFRRPNIYVEIHTEFFSERSEYHGVLEDPFKDATEKNGVFEPSREMFYIYNVLHIAKHYFYAGCGIRRMLDLYYLNEAFPEERESDTAKEIFDRLGITEFVRDASEIARSWFGEEEIELSTRLSEMIGVLKSVGVHGTVERKISNKLSKDGETKTRYVIRRIFPEKKVLLDNYPILKRHPALIPLCWGHRLFGAVTTKRKRISSEVKTIRRKNTK